MIKRTIGGVVFVLVFYLSLIFKFFDLLAILFLLVGFYELIRIYIKTTSKKAKIYVIGYLIIYCIGICTMHFIYYSSAMAFGIIVGLIMINDTFAYLIGRKFGKTHFSKTSPNKTIEGALGGIIVSFIVYLLYLQLPFSIAIFTTKNIFLLINYVIFIVFAILGDLFESRLKRNAKIKDSGTIIYGHGGILDRIDSWIFAVLIINIFLGV